MAGSTVRDIVTPALFVVLWSTGFIGAKLGLPHAPPLGFLTVRFVLASAILACVALATRAPWPDARGLRHAAVAGILIHGVYLGGAFVGMSLGVEAGLTALIVSLQPLLVAALAGLTLGERVTPRQWLGLALGLAGVVLVLARKLGHSPGHAAGALACLGALVSITAGTLYQKRHGGGLDLRTGTAVQYAAAALVTGLPALLLERGRPIEWTPSFLFALAWLVLVLSLGAVSLLYLLIRRGAASKVSSLFFLVPPTTALIAWPIFGEHLGPAELAGMAVAVAGVALASRGR